MDNKSTTKRMIGAVVLVLIAALLLAWLLKGKNRTAEQKDLITEQTQESTPILGFPGVNNGQQQNGEGSLAAENGAGTATDGTQAGAGAGTEYPIGTNSGATTDPAQAQSQAVLGATDPNVSMPIADPNSTAAKGTDAATAGGTDAGAAATAATAGAAAGTAIAGAVESGKEAVQNAANQVKDSTGFQVRDPKGEVREVVVDGQKQTSMGSMGGNATVTAPTEKAPKAASAETKTTEVTTESAKSSGGSTKVTEKVVVTSNASTKDRPAVATGELKPENPRLVNERPVPAPSAQPRNTNTSRPTVTARPAPAAKPADKPEITTANAAASGYVIQVLATSDKAKADDIKSSMTGEGYPVFVTNAKVDGKTVYRVRVGTYPGKGDAAAVQARMKARYAQNQYVQNSFVTKN
jgi:cell division septation protein DedD